MDQRAVKLALARKKLKDHQEKKVTSSPKDEIIENNHNQSYNNSLVTNLQISNLSANEHIENSNLKQTEQNQNIHALLESDLSLQNQIVSAPIESDVSITELFISNKRNLEIQVNELQSQLVKLQSNLSTEINNHNISKQQIQKLENDLKGMQDTLARACQDISIRDKTINELNLLKTSTLDENSNLLDQLEFTKSVLNAKETENVSLNTQLRNIQNQLDITQLQLHQVTSGSPNALVNCNNKEALDKNNEYIQKINNLENQLKDLCKEKEQINIHYEHYVRELNDQLKTVVSKNEELSKEVHDLANRETSLIEQIGEMEITFQNINMNKVAELEQMKENSETINLKQKYEEVDKMFQQLKKKYAELNKRFLDSEAKTKELSEANDQECNHNISMSKLNADITSDKLAAQRATEQNKKMKIDLQELEEAFVKMSRDKLELTERLEAEKFLNRELTIKLAEIDEKAKDMHIKLMAKDKEMIRLQTSYREMETNFNLLSSSIQKIQDKQIEELSVELGDTTEITDDHKEERAITQKLPHISGVENRTSISIEKSNVNNHSSIPVEDAMLKLQERFLKIMEEVANLSDEKHRLEHIVLQLQNETDTICEYVALYQQQRSLLKKRDEERTAQLKLFQEECERLKNQLDELSSILVRFSEDKDLAPYFQMESRYDDMNKVMSLLSNLKNNLFIDPKRQDLELKHFYPCNCCSGQLINV